MNAAALTAGRVTMRDSDAPVGEADAVPAEAFGGERAR
jgi:hypothetical protein